MCYGSPGRDLKGWRFKVRESWSHDNGAITPAPRATGKGTDRSSHRSRQGRKVLCGRVITASGIRGRGGKRNGCVRWREREKGMEEEGRSWE